MIITIPRITLLLAVVCAASILVSGGAAAGPTTSEPSPPPVQEERISTNTGPSSDASSNVTVITAEEIRANGYHTLAEALRWVRGLYVVDDHTYSYVGVRGVQRPGDYNNKVEIAIDGHSVTGNVYGDAYLGAELGLDLERVERIEVTRGQGSTLNGQNAVLAVVNVITLPPGGGQGVDVAAWTGGPSERRGAISMHWAQPGSVKWSLSGSLMDQNGIDLYTPAFDGVVTDGASTTGEHAASFLGSMEWGGMRLGVKFNERVEPTADEPNNFVYDGHNFVELSRSQPVGLALRLDGRGWWDGSRYRTHSTGGGVTNVELGTGDVVGTEWRLHWSTNARSVLTAGVEGQYYARSHLTNFDENPHTVYVDQDLDRGLAALYVQDQRFIGSGIQINGGARLDAYTGYDPVVSPRLEMTWTGVGGLITKLGAGSAYRMPTLYEINDRYGQAGAPALTPEHVVSYEGSLERAMGPCTVLLTGYVNDLRNLVDLAAVDTSGTVGYVNRAHVVAKGVEGEFQITGRDGDQLRLALGWQTTRDRADGDELTDSPRWNAQLVVTHAPPMSWLSVGGGVRWLSSRLIGDGSRTNEALVADARFGARVKRYTTVGLEMKNIFDSNYSDPVAHDPIRTPVPQNPRTFYLTFSHQLRWTP